MLNSKTIAEKYASMRTSELLHFLKEERNGLTHEALSLIDQELKRRRLANNEEDQTGNCDESVQRIPIDSPVQLTRQEWSYVFEMKEQGKSQAEIKGNLMANGVAEANATFSLDELERVSQVRLRNAAGEKLTGSLFFICGLAMLFLPINPGSHQLMKVVAYTSMVIGSLRFLKGFYYKKTFGKILQRIARERVMEIIFP